MCGHLTSACQSSQCAQSGKDVVNWFIHKILLTPKMQTYAYFWTGLFQSSLVLGKSNNNNSYIKYITMANLTSLRQLHLLFATSKDQTMEKCLTQANINVTFVINRKEHLNVDGHQQSKQMHMCNAFPVKGSKNILNFKCLINLFNIYIY